MSRYKDDRNFTPLAECSFEDILEELARRFDYAVVGAISITDETGDEYEAYRWRHGNTFTCQGIAADLASYLHAVREEAAEAVEREEDEESEE